MISRPQVTQLLDEGHSYETAAHVLGIPAGLAFMVATGVPADTSEALGNDKPTGRRPMPSTTQYLIGPPVFNPTRKQSVIEWVHRRAAAELERPAE